MITITEDPSRIIPDIMEFDILNKVILIYLTGGPHDYGGIVKKCHSADVLRIVDDYLTENGISQWCPIGSSLLELLCDVWETYAPDYYIKIFVIDNVAELEEVTCKLDIKNQDIINQFNKIKELSGATHHDND